MTWCTQHDWKWEMSNDRSQDLSLDIYGNPIESHVIMWMMNITTRWVSMTRLASPETTSSLVVWCSQFD